MPIAAQGNEGSPFQEAFISVLLGSLSLSMITVFVLVIIGLSQAQKVDKLG